MLGPLFADGLGPWKKSQRGIQKVHLTSGSQDTLEVIGCSGVLKMDGKGTSTHYPIVPLGFNQHLLEDADTVS